MLRIDTDIAGFRTSPEMEKRYLGQLHSDLDKWLERKLEERLEQVPELRKIPEANLKAVLEYTMGFGAVNYAHMNAALRNGNRDDILEYEPYILNLISALNQFPVFNGLVYRGIRAPSAKILEKYLENGTIMENGFTSATADKAYAFPGNVLFLIKNGGPDIGLISCAPHEKEILIRPGTRFFVSGVRREDSDPLHDAPHEVRPHLTISLTRRS